MSVAILLLKIMNTSQMFVWMACFKLEGESSFNGMSLNLKAHKKKAQTSGQVEQKREEKKNTHGYMKAR